MSTAVLLGAGAVLAVAGALDLLGADTRRRDLAARLPTGAGRSSSRWRAAGRRTVARSRPGRALARRLAGAGLDVPATTFASRAAAGLLAISAVASRSGSPVLAGLATLGAGLGLHGWLGRRTDQRREQLVAQLPDLARLLSNAADAGLALKTGLELAAREIAEPARSELHRVVQAIDVGHPLEDALGALAARLPSREVSVLVTTLVVQQRSGGRIITALRNVAATLEARKEVRREVRTQMAGAVASSTIVAGLGIGSLLLLDLLQPGVLDDLAGSGVGRLVLAVSGGLYALGFTLIRRLTRIEV